MPKWRVSVAHWTACLPLDFCPAAIMHSLRSCELASCPNATSPLFPGMQRPTSACRFFHAPREFEAEVALYRDPALRPILPRIWYASANIDGAVRSRSGYAFPPFFVLERGMTLREWCGRERGFFEVRSPSRGFCGCAACWGEGCGRCWRVWLCEGSVVEAPLQSDMAVPVRPCDLWTLFARWLR